METPSKNPQFCSEQLQSAVDSAKETFENLEETRTRVSNDIKKLEAYLQEQGLKEPFRFGLGKGFSVPDGLEGCQVRSSLEHAGSASGEVIEEAIVWGPGEGERYRLLYEHSTWDGGVDIDMGGDPLYWDDSTLQRASKPLIESKFEIRKRLYPELAGFVHALRKHLTVEKPEPPQEFNPDDIPF